MLGRCNDLAQMPNPDRTTDMRLASPTSASQAQTAQGSGRRLLMTDGQPFCLHDWPLPLARGGVLIVHDLDSAACCR
jgi:hypothetical protein